MFRKRKLPHLCRSNSHAAAYSRYCPVPAGTGRALPRQQLTATSTQGSLEVPRAYRLPEITWQ